MYKRIFLITSVLFCQSSFAQLQPLVGSEWAKNNPGVLPFEECHFVFSGSATTISGNLLFTSIVSSASTKYLNCSSKSLNLEYSIPISYEEPITEPGFFLSSPLKISIDSGTEMRNLHQRQLQEIFATYHGIKIGGGIFIAGGEGSFLKNSNGIKIKSSSFTAYDIFSISRAELSLALAPSVTMEDCKNPYILVNSDTTDRNVEKHCVANDSYSSTPAITPLSIEEMGGLRFMKIRKDKTK